MEPRRRIDQTLDTVVMEAYVKGVSTRSVDDLVGALGVSASSAHPTKSSVQVPVTRAEKRSRGNVFSLPPRPKPWSRHVGHFSALGWAMPVADRRDGGLV